MLIVLLRADPRTAKVFGSIPAIRKDNLFKNYVGTIEEPIVKDHQIFWTWREENPNPTYVFENNDIIIKKVDEIIRSKRK